MSRAALALLVAYSSLMPPVAALVPPPDRFDLSSPGRDAKNTETKLSTVAGEWGSAAPVEDTRVVAPVQRKRKLTKVVFGTLRLTETEQPYRLLDEAWRLGISGFDCAAVYGGGESESIMGHWLRRPETSKEARENAFVITKGGCGPATSAWEPRLDRATLRGEMRRSVARLGRVDAYLLHRDDPKKSVGEIVETMDGLLKEERHVHSWGVSNWSTERLAAALKYARQHKLKAPAYSSLQDSLAEPCQRPWPGTEVMRDADRQWYASNKGITVLGWEAMGKGFLAGRWQQDDLSLNHVVSDVAPAASEGEEAMSLWRETRLRCAYLTPENYDRRDRAARLGNRHGLGSEHVALAWNLAQPYTSHVITATINVDHLRSNVKALELKLDSTDLEWLSSGRR